AVLPFATSLFFILAAIEICWCGVRWTLEGEDGVGILTSAIRHITAIAFFYAILLNAPSWMGAVVDGFQIVGARVAGIPKLNPSSAFDQGMSIASVVLGSLGETGFFEAPVGYLVGLFAAMLIVFAFAIVAGQMLVTLIESFIVLSGGVLLLG